MTSRSIRRAAERKAAKLARKAEKANLQAAAAGASSATLNEDLPLDQEFSPEFIAEANALRDRVWKADLDPVSRLRPFVNAAPADTAPTEPRASASGASTAQLQANRANSQLSTGATSPEGKHTVSFNAFRHGLAGRFAILPNENEHEFKELFHGLQHEHKPTTPTEHVLIEGMAQHYWLAQRATYLQQFCFDDSGLCSDEKQLALYLRYQTTHDRGFHKCLNDLLKLRAEKRKEQIGFVSQQHKEADQARRAAAENRRQELHKWAVLLAQAKLDHQKLRNTPPYSEKAVA